MFMTYAPTAFDINFRLFGFPIRVHPLFWLIMALLGERNLRNDEIGPFALVLWVLCGFFSILVHELGHAMFIRRFGSPCEIVLFGFGGFATMPYPPTKAWKRLLIALAGPAAGFVLVGVVIGSQFAFNWAGQSAYTKWIFLFLVWMGLFWNLLNLLPIWPLDGGRVCRELCDLFGARHPDRIALTVSMVTAGVMAGYGIASFLNVPVPILDDIMPFRPGIFMTFWVTLLAVESYNALQLLKRRSTSWDTDRSPWER